MVEIYAYAGGKFWMEKEDEVSSAMVDRDYIKNNISEIMGGTFPLPLPFALVTFATSFIKKDKKVIFPENGLIIMAKNNETINLHEWNKIDTALDWLEEE